MNLFARHTSRFRRSISLIGLATVLAVSSLALNQCRMVQDSVTGLDLRSNTQASSKNSCVKECKRKNKEARRDEERRHRAASRACKSDKTCRKAEERLHRDNQKDLNQQLLKCKRGCYNEGSGNGGL